VFNASHSLFVTLSLAVQVRQVLGGLVVLGGSAELQSRDCRLVAHTSAAPVVSVCCFLTGGSAVYCWWLRCIVSAVTLGFRAPPPPTHNWGGWRCVWGTGFSTSGFLYACTFFSSGSGAPASVKRGVVCYSTIVVCMWGEEQVAHTSFPSLGQFIAGHSPSHCCRVC
jgi:hypothetical protein